MCDSGVEKKVTGRSALGSGKGTSCTKGRSSREGTHMLSQLVAQPHRRDLSYVGQLLQPPNNSWTN